MMAFFWCMRSCEYSTMSGKWCTKLLCLCNIRFFNKDRRLIPQDSPQIFHAENVSITFEWQKKDVRDDIMTHQCSGGKSMCPILATASIVSRIHQYPISWSKLPNTLINTVMASGHCLQITSDLLLTTIIDTLSHLIHEALGFGSLDVSTHSHRLGGAGKEMAVNGVCRKFAQCIFGLSVGLGVCVFVPCPLKMARPLTFSSWNAVLLHSHTRCANSYDSVPLHPFCGSRKQIFVYAWCNYRC